MPEYLITRYKAGESAESLQAFALWTSAAASILVLAMAIFGWDTAYFVRIQGHSAPEAWVAHLAFFAGCFVPLVMGLQCYARAMVTVRNLTFSRFVALAVSMAIMVVVLVAGVMVRANGMALAGIAVTLSLIVEVVFLYRTIRTGMAGMAMEVPA